MGGVLQMAVQASLWAKDGDLRNGVEQHNDIVEITGPVPWQTAPCKDKVTPDGPSKTNDGPKVDTNTDPAQAPAGISKVLFLRLAGPGNDNDDFFRHSTQRLMSFFQRNANVDTAFTASKALEHINNSHLKAIIVADAALTIRDQGTHFGWVGDVNKGLATDECVFAMCGLSDLQPELDTWYPDTSMSVSLGADGSKMAYR